VARNSTKTAALVLWHLPVHVTLLAGEILPKFAGVDGALTCTLNLAPPCHKPTGSKTNALLPFLISYISVDIALSLVRVVPFCC